MIDRTHRFQGHSSLRFVYQKGAIVRAQCGSLRYIVNRRRTTYRLAVVVSRKVHKSAVVRNRIRRRIYEIIRLHEQQIAEPYDLVMTVHTPQLARMPAEELRSMIIAQCHKAGIFGAEGVAPIPVAADGRAIVEPKES